MDARNKYENSLDFVHNFVHVNAVRIGFLFVVAVPARVEQHFHVFVFLRVQHVVAKGQEWYHNRF